MRLKLKRIFGVLLSFMLVLELFSGMLMTVHADDPYAALKNVRTVVHFDNKEWYLIDYDTSSVTLLSKECVCASKFNDNGSNEYSNSDVEEAVNLYYTESISENVKPEVVNRMFLLTVEQLKELSADVRKCSQAVGANQNLWWSSSADGSSNVVVVNGSNGNLMEGMWSYGPTNMFGVRPALKLKLENMVFSSATNTFSLKPTNYSVTISGGANATINGDTSQNVSVEQAMTSVIYKANTGYYFDEFTDITSNGITATRTDEETVTVSGIPTADTTITIPDAVVKPTSTIDDGFVRDITGSDEVVENDLYETKIINNSELRTLLSLTDAEIAEGVNVWLDIQNIDESVSKTDVKLVQNACHDYSVGLYLDVNLFKKVGSNDATKVTETNGKVKASIVIPESLWKSGRTFEIIRVHDGVATAIEGTYDENTHVFTFETDKFSTYALAYKDQKTSSDSGNVVSEKSNSPVPTSPKTGDLDDLGLWYFLIIVSIGGLGLLRYKSRRFI